MSTSVTENCLTKMLYLFHFLQADYVPHIIIIIIIILDFVTAIKVS
jgi:hypothetical protein